VLDKSSYPDGRVLTLNVDILGTTFTLLNGGPNFTFSEAISFYVDCKDQAEVDYYWDALTTDGGAESMCGWVKDKYGVSWQIAPMAAINRTIAGPDAAGRQRAMAAMMKMKKLVIAELETAYAGK
jgi:predicted 3-demethylubiquinone-9 3-methyltransferase (glyoxalase superfamily)